MYVINSKKGAILVINVLVYSQCLDTLWEWQAIFDEIKEDIPYKLEIRFTTNLITVLTGFLLFDGGVDILISDELSKENKHKVKKSICRHSDMADFIFEENDGYLRFCIKDNEQVIAERWDCSYASDLIGKMEDVITGYAVLSNKEE